MSEKTYKLTETVSPKNAKKKFQAEMPGSGKGGFYFKKLYSITKIFAGQNVNVEHIGIVERKAVNKNAREYMLGKEEGG